MYGTDNEKKNATRLAGPKYHVKKGTKLRLYADGQTDEGRLYFKTLNTDFLVPKNDETFWEQMKEHWKQYTRENHHYSYDQRGNAGVDDEGVYDDDENLEENDFVVVLPDEMDIVCIMVGRR